MGLRSRVPGYFTPSIDHFRERGELSDFALLMDRPLPGANRGPDEPYTLTSTLEDIQHKFLGNILNFIVSKALKKMLGDDVDENTKSLHDGHNKGNAPPQHGCAQRRQTAL